MLKNILCVLLMLLYYSCNSNEELYFEQIENITRERTNPITCGSIGEFYYLVSNYHKSEITETIIDEYYCGLVDSLKKEYEIFYVTFIKETSLSNKTSLENGGLHPHLFEESSIAEDKLWRYKFKREKNSWSKLQLGGNDYYINQYPDCLVEKYPKKYRIKE